MADVKLFLSRVSDEFGDYCDALYKALTLPNVAVKIQEDFKPPPVEYSSMRRARSPAFWNREPSPREIAAKPGARVKLTLEIEAEAAVGLQ